MASNNTPSIQLNSLDFDTNKNVMKSYLQSQSQFADYNFDGSNLSVLMDVLSRNTFLNTYYLNMVGTEMWMDTALLRDSVVSHAKDLNYIPKSFSSAQANVNITVTSSDLTKRSVVVPKGTTFTSSFGTSNYTFSISDNTILSNYSFNSNNTISFLGSNILLYEGYYASDSFVYNSSGATNYIVSNKNVDISSITITVIEDGGANTLSYMQAQSLFNLNASSQVFFVQGAPNDSYEIIFGDGVSGRQPKDNSTLLIEYRISNGELPNGCNTFTPDTPIDGEVNIVLSTNSPASSGSVSESIESIKFNAPRHFTTQERAITPEDYVTLLQQQFPEVSAATAFGGEDLSPPQFGKVFVAASIVGVDLLPEVKKTQYYNYLRPLSPVTPVLIDADYSYIEITSTVDYDITSTSLTNNDINAIVSSAILSYAASNLANFNKTFRYSQLTKCIDNSQTAIISNDTDIRLIKIISPASGTYLTFETDFGIPLSSITASTYGYTLNSSEFMYNGQKAILQDKDGSLVVISSLSQSLIDTVGTVNYSTGAVNFSNFKIDSYFNSGIKIYVTPANKDISVINNVIINIIEEDINLTINPTRP